MINNLKNPSDDIIYCGIDVGKVHHHVVALDPAGEKIISKKFTQDEQEIRSLLSTASQYGTPIVVVDQPRTIGSLLVSVCLDMGITIGYISSLSMRRYADMYPGNAKTDARDALMIARAARTVPEIIRNITLEEESLAQMRMLSGFDSDLAKESTMLINRLRGVLSDIHPALERALAPHIDQFAVLELLATFGGPQGITAANKNAWEKVVHDFSPRSYQNIIAKITGSLEEQTVIIPGTQAGEHVIAFTAAQIRVIKTKRAELEKQFEQLLDDNPLGDIICSMPGIGIRLGTKILTEIGDITAFPTARHLAAYAGLAPRTRRSGTSIKGEYPQYRGNKRLKTCLYLAAFTSLSDPRSKAYYEKKRAEGKNHHAAIICLARQRCTTLYKMLTTQTPYQNEYPQPAIAA